VTTTYSTSESGGAVPTLNVTLDLQDGAVYEIAVFHAERHVTVSSFKLTLDGFATSRSECRPVCGDGIVGLGEECDDGINDGGYGECGPGCLLGSYCGDGVVDEGEECDDGNNLDGDDCGSGCRNLYVY
jgi:cysteine-rich repeat protein